MNGELNYLPGAVSRGKVYQLRLVPAEELADVEPLGRLFTNGVGVVEALTRPCD